MSFRRMSQPLVALIVITTLMITVCDSLPKYCQCIESNGSQFNAFAEYFIAEEKMTKFWLYENKHKCQMFIKNKTEIVIDTSGMIENLTQAYRQWFGFYKVVKNVKKEDVYECRTYPKSQSKYAMECRKGVEIFKEIFSIDEYEYSNALVVIKEVKMEVRLPVIYLFQNESDGKWRRNEKNVSFLIENFLGNDDTIRFEITKESETDSTDLSVLLKDIGSNVYINAVINAFDAKHNTKGFFIFVTNNGIPMYCYKSHIHDRNDSCKIENFKPFMRECFPTTERPTLTTITTISSQTSETNTENPDLFDVLLIAFIVIIIASFICLIPYFICFLMDLIKSDKKNIKSLKSSKKSPKKSPKMNSKGFNFDSNLSTLSTESKTSAKESKLKSKK